MKLKTKLLSLGLIPLLPLSVVSYKHITKQTIREDKEKEEPKNAAGFDTFNELSKKKIEEGIEKVLNQTISHFDNEKKKLEKLINDDFVKNVSEINKLIYVQSILQYLQANKSDLKTNHSNNKGFNVVFPYVLAKNKNYEVSKVKFDNEEFNSIKIGKEDGTDYKKQFNGKAEINKTKDEINTIKKDRLEKMIENYLGALNNDLKSMLYDEKNLPQIGKDFKLEFKNKNQFEFSNPNGFKSWDEYIIAKLNPKFIKFDLKQNENFEVEENEKENNNNEPIAKPDLVPGDKPSETISLDEQVRSLPELRPWVSPEYVSSDTSSLKNAFDSAGQNKNNIFFFDNPINTRYQYSVTNLEVEGSNSLKATISITDRLENKGARSYLKKIAINTSDEQKAINLTYQKIIESNKQTFNKIYAALGLDDKINYLDIKNNNLRDSLFRMVAAGVQVTNKFEYAEATNKILASGAEAYLNSNNLTSIDKYLNKAKYLMLSSLYSSQINGEWYFSAIPYSFRDALLRFKEIIRLNKDIITKNFTDSKFDLGYINAYYEMLNKKVAKLIANSTQRVINLHVWYQSYVNEIKEIMSQLGNLALLVDNKPLSAKETKENFEKAYANVQQEIKLNSNTNKVSLKQFGYAILGISAIILLALVIFLSIKKNQIKSIKASAISIVTISLILAIAIASIIMIIL
ncbi:Hypothetical protein, predicted transmembrane protein [Metamycoplasma auris 15026]|uniref:Transmembrane protein n=1 Tax=Metamycoplasma auris 15026 TaxID=1188233 RepID=N9VBH1_9BACT|nr:hypothetical protein [Metamycoplasma auris]ENY68741.1 Hypothetical protein, predicted transmembrane protein [Metamycoplasma auris 15026]